MSGSLYLPSVSADADPPALESWAQRLVRVAGVEAVVLGGSRARRTHRPDSDVDIGLYYRSASSLDLDALGVLASEWDDERRAGLVSPPGAWGPWVDGGAWMRIGGVAVDWILRDVERVQSTVEACARGSIQAGLQPGHPFGFVSAIYAGEVAVCRVLQDPHEVVGAMKTVIDPMPDAMARGLVDASFWEAAFNLQVAAKAAGRNDPAYVVGCAFRAVMCMAVALCALNRVHWLNEKGAVQCVQGLPQRPVDWAARVARALEACAAGPQSGGLEELGRLRREAGLLLAAAGLVDAA